MRTAYVSILGTIPYRRLAATVTLAIGRITRVVVLLAGHVVLDAEVDAFVALVQAAILHALAADAPVRVLARIVRAGILAVTAHATLITAAAFGKITATAAVARFGIAVRISVGTRDIVHVAGIVAGEPVARIRTVDVTREARGAAGGVAAIGTGALAGVV